MKEKLFELLINLGFTKMVSPKFTYFKSGEEVFVYPNTELQSHHYIATRKQLDANGWLCADDFNDDFEL
jgi:hypothetical protein